MQRRPDLGRIAPERNRKEGFDEGRVSGEAREHGGLHVGQRHAIAPAHPGADEPPNLLAFFALAHGAQHTECAALLTRTIRHRVGDDAGGGALAFGGAGSDTSTAGNTYQFGDIIIQGAQKDGRELADEIMGHVAREMRLR